MKLKTGAMDRQKATRIAGWSYAPPYDLYNLDDDEESVRELLDGTYRSVEDSARLIGFYCVGATAQVPAGHKFSAYAKSTNIVDVGIGLRPDLTGQGLGSLFFGHVVTEVEAENPDATLRLTVATFNRRAIHLYETFHFSAVRRFTVNDIEFQVMERRHSD